MQPDLWKIFENVNRWLEYGERKNAYVLTFVAAELALVKFFDLSLQHWQTVTSLGILGLSLLLTILSFLPKTRIPDAIYFLATSWIRPHKTDNLLFFEHIARYSVSDYISALQEHYSTTPAIKGNRYLEDLCNQIVVNAGIAASKFRAFRVVTGSTFIAQPFFVWAVIKSFR